MLGIEPRQWMAILTICIMLSGVFTLPVRAVVFVNTGTSNSKTRLMKIDTSAGSLDKVEGRTRSVGYT